MKKINKNFGNIILKLGIPFCELLNNQRIILNYHYNLYFKSNIHKNILLNFIDIFNFESLEVNPGDDMIEILKLKDPDTCKYIINQRRNNKNEVEKMYDEITSLISNLRMRINIEDNFEKEIINYFDFVIKEESDKISNLEKENKYPKAIIEYFKEKIKNFENLFNEIDTNKNYQKTFNKEFINSLFPTELDIKNKNSNTYPKHFEISNFSLTNNLNDKGFNFEEILKKLREIPLKNRTSFYKDEQLTEGEDEFTEFKNYYLPLTEEKINELKRQFCAFLNNKGGRLYLGINDKKIVKGIILSYKKCDGLRNLLINYTYDFYPKCRLDKIKVYFIPVKNMEDNKFINNLYVVKVIVFQGEPNILYSMTNKGFNSAIRLQGQCANLTAEEITKEIIRRGKLGELNKYENLNINEQFNDPEPEKNFENESENDSVELTLQNINKPYIIENKEKNQQINKRDIFVVEVKNIDKNFDIKEIYDKFKSINSIYKKFFEQNGKCKGYGLLKFSNANDAISAIKQFNNLQIGEKRISLIIKNKNIYF